VENMSIYKWRYGGHKSTYCTVIPMKYKDLISEKAIIDLQESYISVINLKNRIKREFKTKILSETSTSFSFKIIRFARLFGAPVFFPNPIFNGEVLREGKNTKIHCELLVFDYFFIYIGVFILGFILFFTDFHGSNSIGIKENASMLFTFFAIGNVAVLLDAKYFFHLLKKELKKEIEEYKV
jgi:hypothetical protein